MDNEDVILEQMEDTRTALTEKLETLETKVASSVGSAASDVAETVETVKDTVQETVATVKETVEQTIGAVKESFHEGLQAVQDLFDVPAYVDRQPWAMFAGSVALGYVFGGFFSPKTNAQATGEADAVPASPPRKNGRSPSYQAKEPSGGGLFAQLSPEFDKLKGLAIGTLMGTLREMIVPAVPQSIGQSVVEILDSVTQKMGGTPVDHGKDEKHEFDGPNPSQDPMEMQSRSARTH